MEEEMLKRLVRSRNALKRKLQSIKRGEEDKTNELKNTFKPITEPIHKLLKLSNENASNFLIPKKGDIESYKNSFAMSTPVKKFKHDIKPEPKILWEEENETEDTLANDSKDDTFYSDVDDTINLSLLNKNKKLDTVYGPHKDIHGEWKFGDKPLKVDDQKIIVGNQHWAFTPGLFELLFYKNPKNYDASELEIYKKILLDSNAHKVNYRHNERIKSNRGYKYIHIIKHLMEDTHSGKGLIRVHLDKSNHIYWDDPNVLIERL